jgi:uncharacterized protein YoxC
MLSAMTMLDSPGAQSYQQPPAWNDIVANQPMLGMSNQLRPAVAPPHKCAPPRSVAPIIALALALAVAVVGAVAVGNHFYGLADEWRNEAKLLQAELDGFTDEATQLRAQVSRLAQDHQLAVTGRDTAQNQASTVASQLEEARSEITALMGDIADQNQEIGSLERQLATQRTEANKAKEQLEKFNAASTTVGQVSTAMGNCVNELGRLEQLLSNPLNYDPAQSATWITEHRNLCQGALGAIQRLNESLQ